MAAKFQNFDFYKRFWNWIFQKCTFLGLSENPFCRSLKIQILPPFFCRSNRPHKSHNISRYLYTEPNGKYWFVVHAGDICLGASRLGGPEGRQQQNNSHVFSLNISFCKTFWENLHNKLSSILLQINLLMVWFVVYVERGPEGSERKKKFLALHLLIPFSTKPELIHVFNVDKNGGKISEFRFL